MTAVVERALVLVALAPLAGALLLVLLHRPAARQRRVLLLLVGGAGALALVTAGALVLALVGGGPTRAAGAAALVRLAALAALGGFLTDLVDRRVPGWRPVLAVALAVLLGSAVLVAADDAGPVADALLREGTLVAGCVLAGLCVAVLTVVVPRDTAPAAPGLLRPLGLGTAAAAAVLAGLGTAAATAGAAPPAATRLVCGVAVLLAATTLVVTGRAAARTRGPAQVPAVALAARLAATAPRRPAPPAAPGTAAPTAPGDPRTGRAVPVYRGPRPADHLLEPEDADQVVVLPDTDAARGAGGRLPDEVRLDGPDEVARRREER